MLNRAERLALLIFTVLMLAFTYKVLVSPNRTFDSYFYSYLISDNAAAFKATSGVPVDFVTMPDRDYVVQEPFYTVKLLFVALARLVAPYVGVVQAPTTVSAIAYFLCGGMVWFWLRALGVATTWRTLVASLVMYTPFITDAAVMGTPDLLCTLWLVTATWLLTCTSYRYFPGALLILSVATRTDCLLLGGLLLMLTWWQKQASTVFTILVGLAMLGTYWAISLMGFPHDQLMDLVLQNTGRSSYGDALIQNLLMPDVALLIPFMLLALMAVKLRYQVGLMVVCAVSVVLRYLLLPNLESRYLVPQAVIVSVIAAAAIFGQSQTKGSDAVKFC